MTGWTAQAQMLAEDIREPGFDAAGLNASAWRARVDPAATRGLVGAALALTSNDAGSALWTAADPCPDDKTLLEYAAELEGAVAQLLKLASQMARDCRADLSAAHAKLAGAGAALAAAYGQAAAATTAAQATAAQTAIAAAQAQQGEALMEIADCEAALEVIDEAGTRLAHAANCLARVPGDLASAYEIPYGLVSEGGKLPHGGEFLTGTAA
jgi:hypothetical protein